MSVELYSEKECLGPLATNSGIDEAGKFAMKEGGPNLRMLFKKGYTDEPQYVAAELRRLLAEKSMSKGVKDTLTRLHELLLQVKDTAIIV